MGLKNINFPSGTLFLVTGGAGFIGCNLSEWLLSNGYNVRIIDDLSTGKQENIDYLKNKYIFEFIKGSICNFDICMKVCEGVDYVLHQAAWGSVPRSMKMPLIYDEINSHGTLNMMQAAYEAGVKKFVYASSSSVYGDNPSLPKVEGKEGKPLSPYAITKKVNEIYAKSYYELFGLKTIGLRYFNVFGRRQDSNSPYAAVIPKFIKLILANEQPIIHGDGTQSRDFTYIDNVIEANIKACLSGDRADGEVFNIAYGQNTSIIEMVENLNFVLDKKIKPIYGPPRDGDIKHSLADISKAKHILSYEPDYDFLTGLTKTIEWYIKNNWS